MWKYVFCRVITMGREHWIENERLIHTKISKTKVIEVKCTKHKKVWVKGHGVVCQECYKELETELQELRWELEM